MTSKELKDASILDGVAYPYGTLKETLIEERKKFSIYEIFNKYFGRPKIHMSMDKAIDHNGITFRIIKATNGHIIEYTDFTNMNLGSQKDKFFVVPDGESLIGAISRILVLNKLEPPK